MAKRIAVYIGRFQPFDRGHAYVLEHCLKNYDHTVVLLGSAFRARDIENPFTFAERRGIIDTWLCDNMVLSNAVVIHPVADRIYNNVLWSQAVQTVVNIAVRDFYPDHRATEVEVTLVGCERGPSTDYLKTFPQWGLELLPVLRPKEGPNILGHYFESSVQEIRHGEAHPWAVEATTEFLKSFVDNEAFAALQPHYWSRSREISTHLQSVYAGACVVQSGHLLVTRRLHTYGGQSLRALPRLQVGPSERVRECAVRAVMARTGIQLATGKRAADITESMLDGSIVDFEQFDNPKIGPRGRAFNNVYLMRLRDGKPLPQLGAYEGRIGVCAEWLPIVEALRDPTLWAEDDYDHAEIMISRIKD